LSVAAVEAGKHREHARAPILVGAQAEFREDEPRLCGATKSSFGPAGMMRLGLIMSCVVY
jgi:hypothetical protein